MTGDSASKNTVNDFENWNRYYDPSTGRYLQIEPLQARPEFSTLRAQSGHSVASYLYAGANPVRFSDPTGLFQITQATLDRCPNWMAALRQAKTMLGCDGLEGRDTCACQNKLKECGVDVAKVCSMLEPGKGPWAVTQDLNTFIRRLLNLAFGGKTIDGMTTPYSAGIAFDIEICSNFSYLGILADTILHESLHRIPAGNILSSKITDDPGTCSAKTIEQVCNGIGG